MLVVQKYEFSAFPKLQSQSYLVEEECLWRKGGVQKPFDSQVFRASGILTGEFYTATGLVKNKSTVCSSYDFWILNFK